MKFRFLALLALVLGLASCQNDFEGDNIVTSAEVDFQLSVAAPELAGTRAGENGADDTLKGFDSTHGAIDYLQTTDVADPDHADWTDVDIRYTLEVYDVATDYTNATPVKDRQVIIKDKYEPVVFTLRLVPKRNYHFVVFADFVAEGGAALDATEQLGVDGIRHRIGSTLANIELINENINDEVGDAYFATKDIEITNSAAQPIVLQRPYGKLRVVATDLAELNLNVHPKKVVVEYEALNPNKFNAVTGDISGTYSTKVFKTEFVDNVRNNMANHYYNAGYDAMTAEAVNGTVRNTHITLFTDYILAENINGAGVYPQTTKHFTMKVYQGVDETDANLIKSNTFNTEIPIQRNYLTSVVGNILTTATDIKVTIDDNFTNGNTWNPDQDEHDIAAVSTGLEFLKAYYGARNLLLLQDIVVTAADIAAYNDFVANGGGSIFAATRAAQTEETTTTINLNGFTLSFEDGAKIEVEEGTTVVIEDNSNNQSGKVEAGTDAGFENNGTITIEGGTIGEGAIENNGIVNVNGGTIEEDAIDHNENATIGQYVYTVAELQAAIDAAKDTATETGLNKIEIGFGADIVGNATILQKEGVNLTINGRGFKYDGTLYIHGDSRYTGAETLKFTNINFEAETAKYFIDSNSTGSKERYAHNVTIEKCTFTSLAADNSIAVCGPRFRQAYNITIKDCKATNTFFLAWFTGCKNLTIEGCEAINNHEGVTFGPCNNSVIKDSKIDAELFGVRYEPTSDAAYNVTIENCELSGFIPVSVRNIVAGDNKPINVKLVGNNTLTRSEDSLYDVVFAANEYKSGVAPQAPTGEWEVIGADSYVVFPRDKFIETAADLKSALEAAGAANAGNTTVVLKKDAEIDMTDVEWEPIYVNGYQGADIVTFIGNGAVITGLKAPLFAGGFAGGSGIVIKDLTIKDSDIVSTNTLGSGAFIESIDSMDKIELTNCHLLDSTVTGGAGSRTGGLIGWTAGYNNQNDGPVKTNVTIDNCSVIGCTIQCDGSVGGINGHAGNNAWTYTTISNCTIKNNNLNSTDDGDWRTGVVVGTANVGEVTINNITESGNTLTQTGKTAPEGYKRNYYGRFVGGSTGKLIIDGCAIANTQASLLTALADKEVATVYLGEGKYVPSLYNNDIPTRESLTIIGAGADKTQFAYTGSNYAGQFSLVGFDSITIRDCEILKRENVKEWGMVVFGSSNNANGVYTIENCTFNGVGTQGIFINENVSGATYNILNCTFNGDFGDEGVISIQNNANVDHIVNVLGCTFNVTSNKICVHYAYDGWTLNTDLTDGIVWRANQ